jgi:phenylacetate-CoA ligase
VIRQAWWEVNLRRLGIRDCWRDILRFRAMSPSEARRDLTARLLDQISHFGARADALPEWQEAAAWTSDQLWDRWTELPVLSKHDLQTRFHPRRIREVAQVHGVASATGGSTGEPTPFLHDTGMLRSAMASRLFCRREVGWWPGMPVVCVWGSERDIGRARTRKARAVGWLNNDWLVDGYALSSHTTDRVLELLARRPGAAVYGFTSMLEFLARDVIARSLMPAPVAVAWNGGEMLSEQQSALFRQAFGVPILNYYGGRELSAMAYQPRAGAPLSVLRPWIFVEVVDERGRQVAPGETGRLVVTSTVCRGTPFLRYDVGDVGTYDEAGWDEAGIAALTELQGRSAGLIHLPDGRVVNGLYWNHLFKEFPEVEQFQVAWLHGREVRLRLKGARLSDEREQLLKELAGKVMGEVPVHPEYVDEIPLTRQGKRVQVVRL